MRGSTLLACLTVLGAVTPGGAAQAEILPSVQALRTGGCPASSRLPSLRERPALNRAAQIWSRGGALAESATRAGYAAERISGLHVDGDESAVAELLRDRYCKLFSDESLTEVGSYQRGRDAWVVIAAPFVALRADDPQVVRRLLSLVNAARAHARRCGTREMPAAGPVRLHPHLNAAATVHAADMASRNYFAHVDPENHSPADRVRRTGYDARLVGENLAVGARSADEVVDGWLHSPGHCQNLMDARFTEMGLGFAGAEPPRAGEYWVQVFALPRSPKSR